jgi:hypothetical protein
MKKIFILLLLTCQFAQAQDYYIAKQLQIRHHTSVGWTAWIQDTITIELIIEAEGLQVTIKSKPEHRFYLQKIIDRFNGLDMSDNDFYTAYVWQAKDRIGREVDIYEFRYDSMNIAYRFCYPDMYYFYSTKKL